MKPFIAIAVAATALTATTAFAESTVSEQRRALDSAIAQVNDDAPRQVTQERSGGLFGLFGGVTFERIGDGIGGDRFGARDNWADNYRGGRAHPPAGR